MDPDSNILTNVASPSIATPSLTEEKKEGLSLPETEVQTSTILGDTSVTLDGTIPKALKEAYNNSFVSISKPEILGAVSQKQLLANVEIVKNVSQEILKDAEEDAQVTLAAQVLANNQIFLEKAQRQYQLYLAPGAIHEEQTNQDVPTIENELEENNVDQEGLQNAFTTVKNIAVKALIFT